MDGSRFSGGGARANQRHRPTESGCTALLQEITPADRLRFLTLFALRFAFHLILPLSLIKGSNDLEVRTFCRIRSALNRTFMAALGHRCLEAEFIFLPSLPVNPAGA